jgi:hypothetical protein
MMLRFHLAGTDRVVEGTVEDGAASALLVQLRQDGWVEVKAAGSNWPTLLNVGGSGQVAQIERDPGAS